MLIDGGRRGREVAYHLITDAPFLIYDWSRRDERTEWMTRGDSGAGAQREAKPIGIKANQSCTLWTPVPTMIRLMGGTRSKGFYVKNKSDNIRRFIQAEV